MASRLELSNVTCPESTPANAPVEVPFTWQPGVIRRITVVIPDGHSGLTGIALGYGGNPVLPYGKSSFISGNDEVMTLDYRDNVPGVQWAAFVVNLDLQPHVWQVRFELDEINSLPASPPSVPIPTADILAAGEQLLSGP